jgi:predicted Zn-dependent protease
VELPTAFNPDAADGNFDNQHDHSGRPYDMARVIQHTVTHEIIHVLARWGEHSADTKDVMYKYSKDWRRDDYVSDWYRSLMRVYNE